MVDLSNDCLLGNINNNKSKSNLIFFESITEKQEESSSSIQNSNLGKSKATIKVNKSILKSNDVSKDLINISNLSLKRPRRRETKYGALFQKKKTLKENQKLEELIKEKELKFKQFKRKETKKKTNLLFMKRISFQQDNKNFTFYNQIKNNEETKKITPPGRNTLKTKKSLNMPNKVESMSAFANNKNFDDAQTVQKNKSVNLQNSDSFLDMKYFNNNKKMKHTLLHNGKLNFTEHRNHMHSSNLFEKLKESYLYEKSEALLFKIKICYAFLAVFSFFSILLEIIDVIIFNEKTKEYLDENYHINIINDTNIEHYYFMEERKITDKENTIRVFNLIFSIICFLIHLIIHYIKNNFDKQSINDNRYNYNYYGYRRKRKSSRYISKDKNNNNSNDNHIKFILNNNLITKNYVTRGDIFRLIINCLISLIFYPPGINKVIVIMQKSIIYVCPLNNIFLLGTFFKLINIYFAVYYLSPFNNLLYKTICNSNMIKLDFKFMFRFLLNNFPMSFIIINFIVICLVSCILLYTFEYFSIDIYIGIWNNKGYNDLKNLYNEIFLFSSFIFKNAQGNIKAQTILGTFILLIGGTMGLILSSYLVYYMNILIEFKVEEHQSYTKLIKLLDPLNNEHKASNLLKIFLLMNKMYLDNQNIEENYRIKKDNDIRVMVQKNLGILNTNYFAVKESNNSLEKIAEDNEYKEKKKFIKYICTKFILKVKLLNEIKNFKNNLIVARNNTLSLNDVLKTLGDKMNGNINQLNSKLEILIQNDQKFKNFMKFQEHSLKKIKKIMIYQDFLLNYFIEINNKTEVIYFKENKEKQNKFLNKFNNASNGQTGPRRMKSSFNGPFLNFNKKPINIKDKKESGKKGEKKHKLRGLFDEDNFEKKVLVKRLKSSIVGNNSVFNKKKDFTRSKTNPMTKINVNKNRKKAKSFDGNILNICKNRNNIIKLEIDTLSKINQKRRSLSNKKKQLLDKFRRNLEK